MASTAGRQVAGVGANSNPVEPQMWSYAVPMDEENGDPSQANDYDGSYDGRLYNSASKSKLRSKSSQPSTPGSNGLSNRYSADQGNAEEAYDDLESHRSLSTTRSRGASKERLRVKKKTSKGAVAAITEEEDKWIHRDKLMQIESRELKEMTARFSKGSRAASRAGKSTRTSVVDGDLDPEDAQENQHAGSGRRQPSEFQDLDEEPDDSSPAGPDELMGEELIENSDGNPHSHSRRPSVSRIPVSKNSSGVGSPSDRELASSPPSKTANGLTKSRSRSNSMKGQNAQDAQRRPSGSMPQSPTVGSPKENQGQNASSGRKASGNKKLPASAQRENSNESGKRPTTRDGNARTAGENVEEDPPWMSSMYKPDPRLPPDQQMLPTHARRLAREREEAARLDKENRPPEDEDYQNMSGEGSPNANRHGTSPRSGNNGLAEPDLSDHPAYRNDPDRSQWPLRSQDQSLQGSPSAMGKEIEESPQHSSPGSGNYNLMPNVGTSREERRGGASPKPSQHSPNTEKPLPQPNAPVARLPETKEDGEGGKKEKKGACAGCCAVM